MVDQTQPQQATPEQRVAIHLLLSSAGVVAEVVGQFSTWLVGGIAAALIAILANLDTMLRLLDVSHVKAVCSWLLVALALGLASRYLSVVVSAGVKSGQTQPSLPSLPPLQIIDFREVTSLVENASWPPARWLLRRQLRLLLAGDLVGASGFISKLAQLHALLSIAASACAVIGLAVLVLSLAA